MTVIPKEPLTFHDLRCDCRAAPLLAKYGVNVQGKFYIHVKVWKQRQLISETVITEGVVHLHCPKCNRWNRVRIGTRVKLEQANRPM